jgi:transcriptional regulator with XRE-family HTH domain
MPRRKVRIRQDKIVEVFAERLRHLREARDMTQREIARRAHVTITYISKLESGLTAPGIDLLERIASALGVHVVELLPARSESPDDERLQAQANFDAILAKAGRESISMMNQFFTRLRESSSLVR